MNLNLQIPINPLGYGVVGKNIAEALLKKGADLRVHPIGQPQGVVSPGLEEAIQKNFSSHQVKWPLVKIWHQHQLMDRIGNGQYYGWPIFELDRFTPQEEFNLRVPDRLIVCSKWASNVVAEMGKIAKVVPLGVDRSIFNYEMENVRNAEGTYKFFTMGKLEYRKGHRFIVECFNKAFTPDQDVELNMMVNNPFLEREVSNEWYSSFKNTKLGDKINILNPVDTHHDVARFMHSQDCGLFPARAEGWNLELLEAMSCGKPVIATNYSAHTEYCNNENSMLIEVDELEPAHDHMGGRWFKGQGKWAALDYEQEEQMIDHMRECRISHNNYNNEGIETAKKFTWEDSVDKLLEIL